MTIKTETRYTDAAQAVVAQQGEEISRLKLINAGLLEALEFAQQYVSHHSLDATERIARLKIDTAINNAREQ